MTGAARILFVDDEECILDAFRALLRRHRDRWEVHVALGGAEAIERLSRETFDVVVSDLRMPRVDGVAVLKHVHDAHPHTMRVVLSGDVQRDSAIRVVPWAHQSLGKPCRVGELEEVLDRACRLRDLVSDAQVRTALGGIRALPPVPETYARIVRLLEDDDAEMRDIAAVLAADVGVAAKVLSLANSPFFGVRRAVSSVDEATRLLGVDIIKTLVLSSAVFSDTTMPKHLHGFASKLKAHSLEVGVAARRRAPAERQADAFTAGILHDVGRMAMAMHAATSAPNGAPSGDDDDRLHARVGGYLLGLWGLPLDVVEAVARHHDDALDDWPIARAIAEAEHANEERGQEEASR